MEDGLIAPLLSAGHLADLSEVALPPAVAAAGRETCDDRVWVDGELFAGYPGALNAGAFIFNLDPSLRTGEVSGCLGGIKCV